MRLVNFAAASLCAALLAACSTTAPRSENPEQLLGKRAEERWGALIAGDWEKAYAYFTPGYRDVNAYEGYRLSMVNRQINWTAARAKGVECESEAKCLVKIDIDYSLIGGMQGVGKVSSTRNATETWLKLENQWYLLPQRAVQ